MSDLKELREMLKIDDEDFQAASDAAQKKFKLLVVQLMSEAQSETEQKAVMGGLCAAFASSMLLFKPNDMDAEAAIDSAARAVWLTGMQMVGLDNETLLTLNK